VPKVVMIKCDLLVFKEGKKKNNFDAVLKGSDKRNIPRLGSALIINSCFLKTFFWECKPEVTVEAILGPTLLNYYSCLT